MTIQADMFIEACRTRGHDFFAGVPCSFVKPLINAIIQAPSLRYVGAASEGEVLGITTGAWIAGRRTVAMCQNSGFGNMVNPLTSLNRPFGVPTLLIATWRGQPGLPDEPQHEQMGRILQPLIECLELPWRYFPDTPEDVDRAVGEASSEAEATRRPVVLVMKQGTVAAGAEIPEPTSRPTDGSTRDSRIGGPPPTRREAIRAALDAWPEHAPIVATTGMTGRELFALCDRRNHLYTVGSMGCASAIGLGLALGYRNPATARPVLVLDGDGAALMKLGNLSTIGRERPARFVHVVLNNGTHDSTGGQHTAGLTVDFSAIAAACGYRSGVRVDDVNGLRGAIDRALGAPRPHLIETAIRPGSTSGVGRPKLTPRQIIDRFRATVGEDSSS